MEIFITKIPASWSMAKKFNEVMYVKDLQLKALNTDWLLSSLLLFELSSIHIDLPSHLLWGQ